jgi:hypothetical protein
VLKLEVNPLVVNQLMKSFPKYSKEKAELRLNKYVRTLERLMRRARVKNRFSRNKTYTLEAKVLWDKCGQLGTKKISVHKWLTDNRVQLVHKTNVNYRPSNELSVYKKTKYLTIKDESVIDLLRKMSSTERLNYLNSPTQHDIDEITDYLKDFNSLSASEQNDLYEIVKVDEVSLKNYLLKLANGEVQIETSKQESDADCSEYILRIAQLNNGLLPQLKFKSDFGRTYYKNLSVQNVSKRVREAFLGDSWEYDCKSCSASWKMAFAREHYDSKSRHKVSFDDSYIAMTLYLEYKSEFFRVVIENIFSQMPYTDEYKTSAVKEAMTAIGFGAKLTMGEWKESDGKTYSSSLRDVFNENETLLSRFVNCFIVRQFNKEQQVFNKYIVKKFSNDSEWIKDLELSRINRKVKPYKQSQKISWLYQHAETIMMNIVRDVLKTLGKTVLANVHDAIVVRERLTDSERLMIENLVRDRTKVRYFALGETKYTMH